MEIRFKEPALPTTGALIVGVFADKKLSPAAQEIDKKTKGCLSRALKDNKFSGKLYEILPLIALPDLEASRVVLVGLGADPLDAAKAECLGGTVIGYLQTTLEKEATFYLGDLSSTKAKTSLPELSARIGSGALLRSWCFDKYRTTQKPEDKSALKKITIATAAVKESGHAFDPLQKVIEGVFFARHVVSEPPNVLYPESMAEAIQGFTKLGIKVEVLGEKEMKKLGMGALLGVGQGSSRESQLIVLQWNGGPKSQKPIAFVGKGVTFDTGGISIKPADGMDEMKYDMAGSAAVAGVMAALAGRKAKVNAVGIMGMVENMPSGNAQRPGDIVKTMSGQTIEVLNTDAEGRLVLADAVWYTQNRFNPQVMIDLATLTGAIVVALGFDHGGLFSNNDELTKRLLETGKKVSEKLWNMPMDDSFDKLINSDVADVKNITGQRGAGSVTAAKFIQRFVNNVPWAHLDIAGVAWAKKDTPLSAKGATGFGVRLLDQLVADYYEEK